MRMPEIINIIDSSTTYS